MSIHLTLLGTGTPTPLFHRAGSSYLVTLGEEILLFDCGPGCVRRLLEKGISPTHITHLFLTHLHYDHCVDYGYLVLSRWDQGVGKISELSVYGPPNTERMTQLLFGESSVFGPDLAARTEHPGSHFIYEKRGGVLPRERPNPAVTEVADGTVVECTDWRIKVTEVIHCQPQLTCLAYCLETHGHSIVFGGDTAPTEKLTELAARTARDAQVSTLVLVHLTEQVARPGIRERLLYEAGQIFDGHIIFGEDLLDIPLDGIKPELIQ